jgi:hypothetical protein
MWKSFLFAFLLASTSLRAATIRIASNLENEFNNRTATNVFIVPDPEWALAPPGAGWISYADTGDDEDAISPPASRLDPWAIFTQDFYLPGAINTGSIRVWADDTASVLLDGEPVGPAADLVRRHTCSPGPIGCAPNAFAYISVNGLSQGEHSLTFSVYQTGMGPCGLLYSGGMHSDAAPEPETFLLLGLGMLALSFLLRRLKS